MELNGKELELNDVEAILAELKEHRILVNAIRKTAIYKKCLENQGFPI